MPFDPDLSLLRDAFRAQKDRTGLTIDQITERSGLGRMTVMQVSSGQRHGTLETWLRLAHAFDVSMDELLAPVLNADDNAEGPRNP
ncbi:helix-turn-helix domain-containing protein [Kytococcus sp. Marseille-QA3725]